MPPRRGRPGLIGLTARTAVVAGTATAVSGKVAANQQAQAAQAQAAQAQAAQAQAAQAQAAQAQAAPAVSGEDIATKLQQLAGLHTQGLLSDAEFAAAKMKLLS